MGKVLITRRKFLRAAGASFAAASVTIAGALDIEKRKPNVILVMTDDQGYGDIGVHDNPVVITPNLDRLHHISMRLTNFHVNPNCAPTRAALMTGRYAARTGVTSTIGVKSLLRNDEITMADVFAANGYKTAMFAKWHLGDNYPLRPMDRGFETIVQHKGGGVSQSPDYWGNDRFDDTYFRNGSAEKFEGFGTDIFFAEAIKFINKNKDKPFFIYLPTSAAHGPVNAPQKFLDMYKTEESTNKFYAMISNIDENMGKLIESIKAAGIEKDTILIFMTDNGSAEKQSKYTAGLKASKGSMYDGGHRVPFFIYWPGSDLAHGSSSDKLTAHIDVLPTLIGLCGLRAPDNIRMDGIDLSLLLKGKALDRTRHHIMLNNLVMTEKWRLILGRNTELYDIHKDRGQNNNIAERHPDIVKELKKVYASWEKDITQRKNDFARIYIGSDEENPSRLMAHDWAEATGKIPWNSSRIINGEKCNGKWLVKIVKAGTYRFELRRWPIEKAGVNPLQFGEEAKLKIGSRQWFKDYDPEKDEAVTFEVNLEAGDTEIQTWLGPDRGAYYTYVRRISG